MPKGTMDWIRQVSWAILSLSLLLTVRRVFLFATAGRVARVMRQWRVERRRVGPCVRPPWPCATGESGSPAKRRRSSLSSLVPRPPPADGGQGKRGDTVRRSNQMNPFTCHARWQGSMVHPLLTHYSLGQRVRPARRGLDDVEQGSCLAASPCRARVRRGFGKAGAMP